MKQRKIKEKDCRESTKFSKYKKSKKENSDFVSFVFSWLGFSSLLPWFPGLRREYENR